MKENTTSHQPRSEPHAGQSQELTREQQLDLAKWYYEQHAVRIFEGSHDHGQLVIRNSFQLAGGALIAVPALTAFVPDAKLPFAVVSGFCFGLATILSLLGSYFVHINWRTTARAADLQFRIKIEKHLPGTGERFLIEAPEDSDPQRSLTAFQGSMRRTFWIPHLLAAAYLVVMFAAVFFLYLSFNVVLGQ